jgi:hypothetical protein
MLTITFGLARVFTGINAFRGVSDESFGAGPLARWEKVSGALLAHPPNIVAYELVFKAHSCIDTFRSQRHQTESFSVLGRLTRID